MFSLLKRMFLWGFDTRGHYYVLNLGMCAIAVVVSAIFLPQYFQDAIKQGSGLMYFMMYIDGYIYVDNLYELYLFNKQWKNRENQRINY